MYQKPHRKSEQAIQKEYRFVRLPLSAPALQALETVRQRLMGPPLAFTASQWKWHLETRFLVLRGGPTRRFQGSELVSGASLDHPNLAQLPEVQQLLTAAFPTPPVTAWLGESPPGARIYMHVDNTRHWDEHHRVHVPLLTHSGARLCVDGYFQHLAFGSAWLLNNSVPHGALNKGPRRVHLMVDLRASPELQAWFAEGVHEYGQTDDAALAELERDPLTALTAADRFDSERLARLISQ